MQPVQRRVLPVTREQSVVAAVLDDPAMIEHDDLRRVAHGHARTDDAKETIDAVTHSATRWRTAHWPEARAINIVRSLSSFH